VRVTIGSAWQNLHVAYGSARPAPVIVLDLHVAARLAEEAADTRDILCRELRSGVLHVREEVRDGHDSHVLRGRAVRHVPCARHDRVDALTVACFLQDVPAQVGGPLDLLNRACSVICQERLAAIPGLDDVDAGWPDEQVTHLSGHELLAAVREGVVSSEANVVEQGEAVRQRAQCVDDLQFGNGTRQLARMGESLDALGDPAGGFDPARHLGIVVRDEILKRTFGD
jgi:hypothetical protein